MAHFNTNIPSNKTENLAGGKAYKLDAKTELISAVLTTFLEDKYYESGTDRMERIRSLIASNDPEFVVKLAVYARTKMHLRSVSHLLIAELSKIHRGDDLVRRGIIALSERVDDLTEIAAALGGKLPKQVKRGIRRSIEKFSRYQLAKYKAEGKSVSLVDLFNLVHPNPKHAKSDEQRKAWEDLINGALASTDTWESRLSSGEDKSTVWADMVRNKTIGYMALLRNLRNIEQTCDESTISEAARIITDPEEIAKSKQLPFRFRNAFNEVTNQSFLDAIAEAADHSLANVPHFDGKTLVAVDVSWSMRDNPIQHAAMIASALAKNNKADFVIYDTNLRTVQYVSSMPLLVLAKEVERLAMGGGTNTGIVFRYCVDMGKTYDRIIIVSDNESWVGSYGVQGEYLNYRRQSEEARNTFVYCIDVQGYGTKDLSGERVQYITGFSDKIFDFIKAIESGDSMIKEIEKIEV